MLIPRLIPGIALQLPLFGNVHLFFFHSFKVGVKALSKCPCDIEYLNQVKSAPEISSSTLPYWIEFTFFIAQYAYPLSLSSPPFPMASSYTHHRKKKDLKHSAKESRNRAHNSSTKCPSCPKKIALRTSLLRDSVKKRIFAYMDKGDRSVDIDMKSGLSHPTVKLYRCMWNEERHDTRRRSMKSSRRKAWARVLSSELFQLPFHLKSASDQKPGLFYVATDIIDKEKRKNRAASGSKERDTSPRGEGAGSNGRERSSVQMEATSLQESAILGST